MSVVEVHSDLHISSLNEEAKFTTDDVSPVLKTLEESTSLHRSWDDDGVANVRLQISAERIIELFFMCAF